MHVCFSVFQTFGFIFTNWNDFILPTPSKDWVTKKFLWSKNINNKSKKSTRLGAKILTLNNRNPQFLPDQADVKAILPTHGLIIFTKFHKDWI